MAKVRLLQKSSKDPFYLFKIWFDEASKKEINNPNAMNLSTISKNNKPNSRIVLLKSFDEKGFVFYTNFNSKKSICISSNANVALNFYWKSVLRQVRIEGKARKVSNKESDEYFKTRPLESKIGAWVSNQSSELLKRKSIDDKFHYFKKKFRDKEIPRPSYWSGYRICPNLIEFWQEMPFRLHDRLEYKKIKNKWITRKLYP